jgi:cephalosporin hydroxylase
MVMQKIARELLRPLGQLHRAARGQRKPLDRQRVKTAFFTDLIKTTKDFSRITWLGRPIWQSVLDLWTIQETIAEVRPALLIETGTNRGGSSLFFAHLMDLMDHGSIVTIDIQRLHDLSHPRITYLLGSSTANEIVRNVGERASAASGPVMVILDSDHSQSHVAAELELYAPLVTPGSYCLVQDGIIDLLPLMENARPGPLRSIDEFLGRHAEF